MPKLQAILVLGRGVSVEGKLYSTGEQRAVLAAEMAAGDQKGTPIVFSGWRSWRQARAGQSPPSEAQAMYKFAAAHVTRNNSEAAQKLITARWAVEPKSESTVENFVNSASLLQVKPGDHLGVISDDLHFKFGRPQRIAAKVLPGVIIVPIHPASITRPTQTSVLEELANSLILKIVMIGVRSGDGAAIMRRQRLAEGRNPLSR